MVACFLVVLSSEDTSLLCLRSFPSLCLSILRWRLSLANSRKLTRSSSTCLAFQVRSRSRNTPFHTKRRRHFILVYVGIDVHPHIAIPSNANNASPIGRLNLLNDLGIAQRVLVLQILILRFVDLQVWLDLLYLVLVAVVLKLKLIFLALRRKVLLLELLLADNDILRHVLLLLVLLSLLVLMHSVARQPRMSGGLFVFLSLAALFVLLLARLAFTLLALAAA